jgi:hypothetical protein
MLSIKRVMGKPQCHANSLQALASSEEGEKASGRAIAGGVVLEKMALSQPRGADDWSKPGNVDCPIPTPPRCPRP